MINDNIVISRNILLTDLDDLLFNHTQAQAINFGLFSSSNIKGVYSYYSVVWYLPIKTDTSCMDFHLVVNPEEEVGLNENEAGEEVNQPHKGEKSNKCN